jgi:hypothetical protein
LIHFMNVTIESHEYVLPSVAKKKVAMTSVLSIEAFPVMGLALQLEVPMAEVSILGPIVGEEC